MLKTLNFIHHYDTTFLSRYPGKGNKTKIHIFYCFYSIFLYIQVKCSMQLLNTAESFTVFGIQLCKIVITALGEKYENEEKHNI